MIFQHSLADTQKTDKHELQTTLHTYLLIRAITKTCLYTVSDGKAKIKVKAGWLIAGIKKKAKYYLAKLAVSFDLNYLLTSDCSHVFMGRLGSPHTYIYFLLFAE